MSSLSSLCSELSDLQNQYSASRASFHTTQRNLALARKMIYTSTTFTSSDSSFSSLLEEALANSRTIAVIDVALRKKAAEIFNMRSNTPLAPTSIVVSHVTSSSITIDFVTSPSTSSYTITCTQDGSIVATCTVSSPPVIVRPLQPLVSYTVSVQGHNALGTSDTTTTVVASTTAITDYDKDLYMHFKFRAEDVVDSRVYDHVSGTHTASLVNSASISTTDSLSGGSLYLSAEQQQYVSIDTFSPGTNGLTFAFWFKDDGSQAWARIFDFGNGSGVDNTFVAVNPLFSGNVALATFHNDVQTLQDVNESVGDNRWRHFVWVLSYATEGSASCTFTLYINGELYSTYDGNYYPAQETNLNYIGKSNWTGDSAFNGSIEDFRIYHTSLDQDAAYYLYQLLAPNH